MSEQKSILKSASIISLATLCSRILGLLRDIVIAAFFGTGLYSEAFFIAFRIPNLLRHLVGEGAANSAFVPVFCEYELKEDKKIFWDLVGNCFWIVLIALAAICILGILFARPLVGIIAPGFLKSPSKFLLTVQLTRMLFPYLLLVGLAAYVMGLLHTFKSFAAPAFSQCLFNICLIAGILASYKFMSNSIFGLAWGVLAGGLLQVGIQIPSLFKKGFGLHYLKTRLSLFHPAVKKIGALLLPRIFGSAVYQLNVLIDTILASLSFIVGSGAVAAIYYSNRLVQLPLALFGIALSSAILPTLSKQSSANDIEGLKSTLNFSLRTIYFLILPAAVGLVVLSQPITRILFQRGSFGYYSAQITSYALLFYSMGLVFFGGMKVLIAGFYSLQDTRTPVAIAALALLLNIILNIILMFPMKVGGLALASSLSAGFNFCLLYLGLKKKIGWAISKDLYIYLLKISASGITMGIFILYFFYRISLGIHPILKLGLTIIMAMLLYLGLCLLLRVEKISNLLKWIKPN